jgi:hypothetical protein
MQRYFQIGERFETRVVSEHSQTVLQLAAKRGIKLAGE